MTEDTAVRALLQGGLDPHSKAPAWGGRVEALAMTGRGAFQLQSPATLQASANAVELGDARLRGEWGEAHFITTRWTPRTLDLKGTSPGIVIQNLARSLRVASMPRSDLVVSVDWDVHGAETLDGHVALKRVSGDLRVGEPPLPLGLQALALQADIVRGRATATAELAGDRVGRLQGRGSGLIVRGASGWSFAPDAPVTARVVAEHTNIEALSPWLGVDARLAGRINATVDVTGTGNDPRLAGELRAVDLAVREPQSGFEVEDGQVVLRLAGKSLAIERFSARTPWRPPKAARERFAGASIPEAGTLQAEGGIDLERHTGTLRLRADHAVVTQTPSRFVAISGEASLAATADGMLANGKFAAEAGWVGALDTPLPSVSEDVLVVRA
jgi:translocation and assembly module TamB